MEIGMSAAFFGIILYSLLGSISRSIVVLDATVILSLSMTLLGLLAALIGGLIWAWRASIVWLLVSAIVIGGPGLLLAEFGNFNVHGPDAILVVVVLAALAIGGLFLFIAVLRFALSRRTHSA
jgi:hypothetical protein